MFMQLKRNSKIKNPTKGITIEEKIQYTSLETSGFKAIIKTIEYAQIKIRVVEMNNSLQFELK